MFIFIDSSTNAGGIECLLIETMNYLVKENKEVCILTQNLENSIYNENTINEKVNIIKYFGDMRISLDQISKLNSLKEKIINNFHENKNYYIVCPYFSNLQIAIFLFKDIENAKIVHLWGHPEDWIRTLSIKKNKFANQKKKNKLYYYQKKLLLNLNETNSDYYGAEIVPIYNSWYYNINLKYKKINLLPISNINNNLKWKLSNQNIKNKVLKVIWCGRFEYWKNEAIIHIWEVLEEIAGNLEFKIQYDIIAYGSKEDEIYVKNKIKSKNVEVNYIGKCNPKKLSEMFINYDIGIGMGLTVKKMAQVGLPAILIDSVGKNNLDELKAEWLFNTKNGDAGDTYYFLQAGKVLNNKRKLEEVIKDIIIDGEKIDEYSLKCKKYVEIEYSQDRQIEKMIDFIKKSEFKHSEVEIYRENIFMRLIYKIYKLIKNVKRGIGK